MADFSDAEDRLLFRLAKQQLDEGHKIDWNRVWQEMKSTGKTQHQLQIRLKTLKRTYGTRLDRFPRRFFTGAQRGQVNSSIRTNTSVSSGAEYSHRVVGELFRAVSQQQVDPRRRDPDQHTGEISEVGVTSMLSALPELKATDIFLDIGSGIGNVVAQVALESNVGGCVGVEVQSELAELSKILVASAKASHLRLTKICVHDDDIRHLRNTTMAAMQASTVVFSNNLGFNPSSNLALETFVTRAPRLAHVITMSKLCGRHREDCKRPFCAVWSLHQTIPVSVTWSAKLHNAFWYIKH